MIDYKYNSQVIDEVKVILIDEGKTELKPCKMEDIREGELYNISFITCGIHNCNRSHAMIGKTRCISACAPKFIFDNRQPEGLKLDYNDIIVISKCREDEDAEDWDRFTIYANRFEILSYI